jgi:hypothetical protein
MKKMNVLLMACIYSLTASYGQEIKWTGPSVDLSHGKLVVSENNRYLAFEDGAPFFYLGDTGWELFRKLDREETLKYLEDRREKGITVIQAILLPYNKEKLALPNKIGETALIDMDPLKPNEKYFEHVDWVIQKAAEKGLFMALLPVWGDHVSHVDENENLLFNPQNGYGYGSWLGKRYCDYQNIIWINGGDKRLKPGDAETWEAIARGIKTYDTNHLMSYHPMGGQTSYDAFPYCDWLDFDMMQSGHDQRSYHIYKKLLLRDYAHLPVRPIVDGEPRYEDHPVKFNAEVYGRFIDSDIRESIYWNLFSGACGYTYGATGVWMFLQPEEEHKMARLVWTEALNLPGGWDLIHARKLIESRPFFERRPAQELVLNQNQSEEEYIVATRGNYYAMVYSPKGVNMILDLDKLGWKEIKAWWFNPRDGEVSEAGVFEALGARTFSLPKRGRLSNDWILVLDDASGKFPPPGELLKK